MKQQKIWIIALLLLTQAACFGSQVNTVCGRGSSTSVGIEALVSEQAEVIESIMREHADVFSALADEESPLQDEALALVVSLSFYSMLVDDPSDFTLKERLSSFYWQLLLGYLYFYHPSGDRYAELSQSERLFLDLTARHFIALSSGEKA